MPFVKSFDKTRIYYTLNRKNKDTLIFVHSWPHNHTIWKKSLKYFNKKNFSTLALDLRGHGKSGMPENESAYKLENFAKDLYLLIKKHRIVNPVLIGYSFGSMIILKFVELFPKRAKAIILIGTTYENPIKNIKYFKQGDLTPLIIGIINFILKHDHGNKKQQEYVDFSKFRDHLDFYYCLHGLEKTPLKIAALCLKEMIEFDEKKLLRNISIPTLLVAGERDYMTPLSKIKKMKKMIPNSKLAVIKNATHAELVTEPDKINKEIISFLNTL